jgi:hypothetical protein
LIDISLDIDAIFITAHIFARYYFHIFHIIDAAAAVSLIFSRLLLPFRYCRHRLMPAIAADAATPLIRATPVDGAAERRRCRFAASARRRRCAPTFTLRRRRQPPRRLMPDIAYAAIKSAASEREADISPPAASIGCWLLIFAAGFRRCRFSPPLLFAIFTLRHCRRRCHYAFH